jgi:hypothetical protein
MANNEKDFSGWLGAGGLSWKNALKEAIIHQVIPWQRSLEGLVDAIVDVLPLPSGFSRDAHGRLFFSETPNGRGWGGIQQKVVAAPIVNYCIQDVGVRVMRLRKRS